MNISQRIRLIRGNHTQDEFAEAIGVSKISLTRYESGERTPDFETLNRICEHFNIHPGWLLTGQGFHSKGIIIIRSEGKKDFRGRSRDFDYRLDQYWSNRAIHELKHQGKTIDWLCRTTKIIKARLDDLLFNGLIPAVDEVLKIADALKLNPTYIAEPSHFKADQIYNKPITDLNIKEMTLIMEAINEMHLSNEAAKEIIQILHSIFTDPMNVGKLDGDILRRLLDLAKEAGKELSEIENDLKIEYKAFKRLTNWGAKLLEK
jgi:transcriptional regulator with XRE-family HTH domain